VPQPPLSSRPYIHGASEREQRRLVKQADLLRVLLADNLEFHPGEHLLEIGCGVVAVLGQIGQAHPKRGSAASISTLSRSPPPASLWPAWGSRPWNLWWATQRSCRGRTAGLIGSAWGGWPPDRAIETFLAAFVAHFNHNGDAHADTRLAERDNASMTICIDQARVVGALNWATLTRA